MLTNWATIKTRVDRLKDLERRDESGALDRLPKKEASTLRREMEKLTKSMGGIKEMPALPDAVFVEISPHPVLTADFGRGSALALRARAGS